MRAFRITAIVLCALVPPLASCADDQEGWKPAEREFRAFQEVHPILMRDCGFHTCHGSPERFFRVWGPGRARLDPEVRAFDRMTGDEASLSFQLALSMIDTEHPERSLLLRKPLAASAGGAPHGGVDRFGRDIYRTVNDSGYLALARFVLGVTADDPQ